MEPYPFIMQVGPILVGVLACASIVIGAHFALSSSSNPGMTTGLTRMFAFGVGAFFAAVCLDILPDAWSPGGDMTPYWIFFGALVMWAATHLSDGFFVAESSGDVSLKFTRVSALVLAAALSFHTFFEGAAVAFSFHHLNTATLGFSLAVILHKLPEGVLWGLALAAVFPQDLGRIKTVLAIPAICTLVGVFLGIFLANQASSQALEVALGFVAGAMLYIAFAELLPALRETAQPRISRTWFIIGLVIMFVFNTGSNFFVPYR